MAQISSSHITITPRIPPQMFVNSPSVAINIQPNRHTQQIIQTPQTPISNGLNHIDIMVSMAEQRSRMVQTIVSTADNPTR